MKSNTQFIAKAGIIATLYIVLTLVSNLFGMAAGFIQLRLSEMLAILAIFTPAAIPGLAIGCFISNILSGCIIWDVVFGSLATLIGAIGTWYLKKNRFLALIPPILSNTVIIPLVLSFAYHIETALPLLMLSIFLSEVVSCGILGHICYTIYKKIEK